MLQGDQLPQLDDLLLLSNNEPLSLVERKKKARDILEKLPDLLGFRNVYTEEQSKNNFAIAKRRSILLIIVSVALSVASMLQFSDAAVIACGSMIGIVVIVSLVIRIIGGCAYDLWHYKNYINGRQELTKKMDALKKIENQIFGTFADHIQSLLEETEGSILNEADKFSPNVILIAENVKKAELFRESLFSHLAPNNQEILTNSTQEFRLSLEKWIKIQKGRKRSNFFIVLESFIWFYLINFLIIIGTIVINLMESSPGISPSSASSGVKTAFGIAAAYNVFVAINIQMYEIK
jgi:hypothetical protein